jgi:hypothetical protein
VTTARRKTHRGNLLEARGLTLKAESRYGQPSG